MVARTRGFVPPVAPQNVVGTGHGWMEPVSMEGAHKAVDLQAVRGTPARSPIDGVVANVKYEPKGLGLQVQIMGKDRKLHTLAHLDKVNVAVGDEVKAKQPVAAVGDSGAGATGPHLDYRRQTEDGQYDDPTADLGGLAQMPRADKPPGWEPPPVGAGQFEGFYEDPGQFGSEDFGGMGSYGDPYGLMEYGGQEYPGAGPQASYGGGWDPMEAAGYGSPVQTSGFAGYGNTGMSPGGPSGLGDWFDSFPGPGPMMAPYGGGGQYGSTGFGNPGFNYGSNYGGSAWSVPPPPGRGGYGGGGGAYGGPQLGAPGFSGTPSGYRDMSAPMGGGTNPYGGMSRGGTGSPGANPYGSQPSRAGAQSQSSPGSQGYGGGRDTMPFSIPEGGVYGDDKWLPGSTGTDIFLRRGSPITAKTGGRILYATGGTGLQGGSDTIAQFDDGTVARFRHVQPNMRAGDSFRSGQVLATVSDSSMDMLNPQVAGRIGAPDGYQHLDLSVNGPGETQFSPQGGGGGRLRASDWLRQHGYQGRRVARTPGPQEGQMGGGMGMGGGFGGPGGPGGFPGFGFGRGQDVGVGAANPFDFSLIPAGKTNLEQARAQGWNPGGLGTGTPGTETIPTMSPGGHPIPFTGGAIPTPEGVAPRTMTAAEALAYGTAIDKAYANVASSGNVTGTPTTGATGTSTPGALGGWNVQMPTIPAGWTGGAFDPFVRPGRVGMFDRPDPDTDRLPWMADNVTKPTIPIQQNYQPNLAQSQQWGQAAQALQNSIPEPTNYAAGIMANYQSPPWLSAPPAGGPPGGAPSGPPPPLDIDPSLRMGRFLGPGPTPTPSFQHGFARTGPVGGGQDSGGRRVLDAVRTDRGWAVPDVGVGQTPYDQFSQQGTNPYAGFSGGGETPQGTADAGGGMGYGGGFERGSSPNQGQLFIGPSETESLNQSRYGLMLNTGQLGINQQLAYNTMMGTQGQLQQLDDQYRQYYDALKQQYAIHGNDDAFRRDELALQNQWSQQKDQLARDLGMMQSASQSQTNQVNLTGLQLNYDSQLKRLEQEWRVHGDDDRYRNDVLSLQKQTQEQANQLAVNQQTMQGQQFWAGLGSQESQYARTLEEQRSQFGQTLSFKMDELAQQLGLSREQLAAQIAASQAQDKQARDLAALSARNSGFDRQLALAQTSLRNPWVQQLSGMAPAYGAPGGPGAAYAAAAGGAPVGWTGGGQDSGPGWYPVGAGADNQNPYDAWGPAPDGGPTYQDTAGQAQYDSGESNLGFESGFRGAFSSGVDQNTKPYDPMGSVDQNTKPYDQSAGFGPQSSSGQNMADDLWYQGYRQSFGTSPGGGYSPYDLNNDQIVDIRDLGLWRQRNANRPPTATPTPRPPVRPPPSWTALPPPMGTQTPPPYPTGFEGLEGGFNPAPLYTPPPQPGLESYSSFIGMTPFQRAGLRTRSELSGLPWEQYTQNMRAGWANTGGPTTAPGTSQLAAQQLDPLDIIGKNQVAEAFGNSPDQYWKAQVRGWAPSQWSGAQMQV